MSKNATVFLEGELYWTQHLMQPEDYLGKKFYKVALYPTDESLDALKKSGSRTQVKTDSEGRKFINLRRDFEKDFKDGKGVQPLGAPKVVHPDGAEFSIEEATKIGNGTEATVRVTVYNAGSYGKGTRLDAVRIDNLVVYEGNGNGGTYFPEKVVKTTESTQEGLPF